MTRIERISVAAPLPTSPLREEESGFVLMGVGEAVAS
jgi:hypothetical protein